MKDQVFLSDGRQVFVGVAIYESGSPTNLETVGFMVAAKTRIEAQGKVTFIAKDILKQNEHLTRLKFAEVAHTDVVCEPNLTVWNKP